MDNNVPLEHSNLALSEDDMSVHVETRTDMQPPRITMKCWTTMMRLSGSAVAPCKQRMPCAVLITRCLCVSLDLELPAQE